MEFLSKYNNILSNAMRHLLPANLCEPYHIANLTLHQIIGSP